MERYIKPSCEIMEIAENDNLLLNTYSTLTHKPAYAPKHQDITSSSLTQPDLWKEEERSDMDYYMEAYEK